MAAVRIPEGNTEIFSGKYGHDPVLAGDPVDPAVINGNELLVLLADDGKVVFVKADRKAGVTSQDLIQHRGKPADQKSLSCKIKDQEKEGGASVIKGQLMAAPKEKEKACGGKEGGKQADCDGKPPGEDMSPEFFYSLPGTAALEYKCW